MKAEEEVGAGTTRHFPQMLEVIQTRMGTEPHLPQWPLIATDIIAVELGKLTTGGYGSTQEGMDTIKRPRRRSRGELGRACGAVAPPNAPHPQPFSPCAGRREHDIGAESHATSPSPCAQGEGLG